MKRCILILLTLLLTGCTTEKSFETVSDVYEVPAPAEPQPVHIWLPDDAAAPVMENETSEALYLCDGFCVTVHTMPAGDLDHSLRELTGFGTEQLTLMQTNRDGFQQTECVWMSAGEAEDQIGRLKLIDDGSYHYAITAMAPASGVRQIQQQWDALFDAFYVGPTPVSTGS